MKIPNISGGGGNNHLLSIIRNLPPPTHIFHDLLMSLLLELKLASQQPCTQILKEGLIHTVCTCAERIMAIPRILEICILTPYNFPFTWRSAGRKGLSGPCYSRKRRYRPLVQCFYLCSATNQLAFANFYPVLSHMRTQYPPGPIYFRAWV